MNYYAAKVMGIGVMFKAIVMGTLVSILAVTSFVQSVVLVLVSATATGIFGLIIVLIQVHSERALHERMDRVETQINTKSDEIQVKQDTVIQKTDEIATQVAPEEK